LVNDNLIIHYINEPQRIWGIQNVLRWKLLRTE
jgi:hypothetical protein